MANDQVRENNIRNIQKFLRSVAAKKQEERKELVTEFLGQLQVEDRNEIPSLYQEALRRNRQRQKTRKGLSTTIFIIILILLLGGLYFGYGHIQGLRGDLDDLKSEASIAEVQVAELTTEINLQAETITSQENEIGNLKAIINYQTDLEGFDNNSSSPLMASIEAGKLIAIVEPTMSGDETCFAQQEAPGLFGNTVWNRTAVCDAETTIFWTIPMALSPGRYGVLFYYPGNNPTMAVNFSMMENDQPLQLSDPKHAFASQEESAWRSIGYFDVETLNGQESSISISFVLPKYAIKMVRVSPIMIFSIE